MDFICEPRTEAHEAATEVFRMAMECDVVVLHAILRI